MKKFGLIGAAGYIAPRHMQAIKELNSELVCAYDPYDGVGIIDFYFPKSNFFTEFERFDRYVSLINHGPNKLDFISICSPNYLHDSHIRYALRQGIDTICEKPIVLSPWNIDSIQKLILKTGKEVNAILQLRLHPSIIELKKMVENESSEKIYDIDLTYLTSRGNWYYSSWKGNEDKSGGIATNIGVHFFDMLMWVFGKCKKNIIHKYSHDRASGVLELEKANVRWFLGINSDFLPEKAVAENKTTYRSIKVNGTEIEFSGGFTDLHTKSYDNIINKKGYSISDCRNAIEITHSIRSMKISPLKGEYHPLAKFPNVSHPFEHEEY